MTPFEFTAKSQDKQTERLLGGGTQLVDLMRLGVERPLALTRVTEYSDISQDITEAADYLVIGAAATMSEVARHPAAQKHKALVQSLLLAASPQIRNMATIGGNLLQRTRCPYFREVHSNCNKRRPGSGCAAIQGDSRGLAILGTSRSCIANYPGDLASALLALDAELEIADAKGEKRNCLLEELHCLPGDTPNRETNLQKGERILNVKIPHGFWSNTVYVKHRDRASYAFALASVAVALRYDQHKVQDLRIVLGGLTAKPWRCRNAENALQGESITQERALEIGRLCLTGAIPTPDQEFKIELGGRVVAKALLQAANMT